jgi:C-terminal processing protease CtpA/Prc
VNKPLYVLTSSSTFSAAEGFTAAARRLCHAVVVGKTTRGGSHPAKWFNVHPNFTVSVPIARQADPKNDWEGKGIAPDVETSDDALHVAYSLALRELQSHARDASIRSELDDAIAHLPANP